YKIDNVITVPNQALVSVGSQRSVYVIREKTLKNIPIKLGFMADYKSEVVSGDLHEGDVVVTNPQSIQTLGSGK
ncbi:MAG TPA: hypothetical protein VF338_12595, partial [Leptolinea sp.]